MLQSEQPKKAGKRKLQLCISVIAILLLTAISVGAWLLLDYHVQGDRANYMYAYVRQNGELLHALPLNIPAEVTVTDNSGNTNKVIVADGTARVISANCPDQVCVNIGAVDGKRGELPIICLPHRLEIRVANSRAGE